VANVAKRVKERIEGEGGGCTMNAWMHNANLRMENSELRIENCELGFE